MKRIKSLCIFFCILAAAIFAFEIWLSAGINYEISKGLSSLDDEVD